MEMKLMAVCLLLWTAVTSLVSSTSLTYACPQYVNTPNQVVVNSYSTLSCAINAGVVNIFINSSFAFPSAIQLQHSNVRLYGLGTSITLSTTTSNALFNITSSSDVKIQDLILKGSSVGTAVVDRGGLLAVTQSTVTLNHTQLIQGYSTCGSAIYASNQATIRMFNSNVTENTVQISSLCGAAVYLTHSTLNATQSTFRNNIAYTAGAIYSTHSSLYLKDVDMIGNQATGENAGAMALVASSLHMLQGTIQNNIAERHGGAIYLSNSQHIMIFNVKFISNIAMQGFGGSVYISNSTVIFSKNQVYSSHALSGGGIYISDGTLISDHNQYMYNFALYGGALYCSGGSNVQFNQSTVSQNVVRAIGGGIAAATNCSLLISSSTFTNNAIKVTDTPLSLGGGISCQQATVNLVNSNISSCVANEGGALFAYECEVSVNNMHITKVQSSLSGIHVSSTVMNIFNLYAAQNIGSDGTSVIYCGDHSICRIQQSRFEDNSALELGVLQVINSVAVIEDSSFINNVAEGLAGAIYFMYGRDCIIRNCIFTNNVAVNYGGAIAVEIKSQVNITTSTFKNNQAVSGGALYVFANSQLDVTQSSFDFNSATESGGTLYVGGGSFVTADHINITHSTSPYGGGIYCSFNSTLQINWLIAQYNRAGYAGGMVALFDEAYLQISNSNFTNNEASLGGVISGQYYTSASFHQCSFQENIGESFGGIAYILVSSSLIMTNCYAEENQAQFGGGGIFVETSTAMLKSSTFNDHHSEVGAALYLINSIVDASYCNYNGNGIDPHLSDSMTYTGGVMYLSSSSNLRSSYSTFNNNAALLGGSLAIEDSKALLFVDTFTKCAGKSGTCIYSIVNASITIQYTNFVKNTMIFESSIGLVSINGGYLSLAHSSFRDNIVQSNGVLNLLSVNTKILNSTFIHNTAINAYANSGAVFIACTSPCVASTSSTNISQSFFQSNAAYGGCGGSIYIDSFPGDVFIQQNVFDNNLALNGGAIASQLTHVYIDDNLFANNTALEGGGAIFWKFNTIKQAHTSNNKHHNNSASYGDYHATEFIRLNSTFPENTLQVSGSSLSIPVNVSLLDFYGQVVTNSSVYDAASTTIYCSVNGNTGIIKGKSIVPSVRGVATFAELVITGYPSDSMQLRFTAPISSINDDLQEIEFRECVAGEITNNIDNGLASCELCPAGLYSLNPSDTACKVCPNHVTCLGGNNLRLERDFWRIDATSDSILECPVAGVCLGGNNTDIQCSTGQEGPYCSVCSSGYTKGSDGVCYSCHSSADVGDQITTTVLFLVVLLLALVLYRYRKPILRYYMNKMKVIVKNRKFTSLRVKAKIVVAFIQIVGQFGPAFNIVYPVNFSSFLNFFSFFQVNILYFPNINCMVRANYYDSLLFTTISPFVIFVLASMLVEVLVIHAKRLNHRNPWYTAARAKEDRITVAFLLSYFVLITVSTKIFQVYACETFDNNESYLVADYSINCNNSYRSFYVAYGTAMIFVYPLGIPLAYAIMLFRNRTLINPDWRKVIDSSEKSFVSNKIIQKEKIKIRNTYEEIENIKNLFDSYTPKRWYFELFDCARRLALGALPVLVARGTSLQIIVVLIVSLISVGAFMYLNPYIHVHDNDLAILAQWSITMVIISTLVIKVQALSGGRESTSGLGGVMIFLNLVIILLSIATAVLNTKETSDDDPKGLFGEDLEDEEGENEDGEGESNEDVEAGDKKRKTKAARGSMVDSDLGSDEEDASSLNSDDEMEDQHNKNRTNKGQVPNPNDIPPPPAGESPSTRAKKLKGIFKVMRRQSNFSHAKQTNPTENMEVEMHTRPSSVDEDTISVMNPVFSNSVKAALASKPPPPPPPTMRYVRDEPDSDDEIEE